MAFGKKAVDVSYQIQLAHDLYKYQNYKGSIIPSKVKSDAYQTSSIIAFHSLLRKYVHTGKKDLQRATEEFYTTIDQLKAQCFSVLRPSDDEAARPYTEHNFGGKNNCKVTKDVSVQTPVRQENKINISQDTLSRIKSSNTVIGVQVNDSIKLFDNEDVMKGFISAFSYMENPPVFKKVKITITEI